MNPPVNAPENTPDLLTDNDLLTWFQNNCTPKKDWRIGTEHEIFVFNLKTKKPAPFEGEASIQALMQKMAEFGWQPDYQDGYIMRMKRGGASLTLEPAGQFELSGAPFKTLHETADELKTHFKEIKQAGEALGLGFLPIGFHPTHSLEDMPIVPDKRHKKLRAHMPRLGERGRDVMYRTCTVQVNLDYSSEQDMADKMRVSMALQPIAIALWANSPFEDGKKTDYLSLRSHCWTKMDETRTGFLPQAMEEGFCFQDFISFARNIPIYYIRRDFNVPDSFGLSFHDFINGTLATLPKERATLKDWENHLSDIFTEVRLKKIIEMRGTDCGSPDMIRALPAFWVGLLYDAQTLQKAKTYIRDWSQQEILSLYEQARTTGLSGAGLHGTSMHRLAADVLALAKEGLSARALGEEIYLEPLDEIIKTGKTRAEQLIETVEATPNKNPTCLFDAFRL